MSRRIVCVDTPTSAASSSMRMWPRAPISAISLSYRGLPVMPGAGSETMSMSCVHR